MGEDFLGNIEEIIDEIRNERMDADYGINKIYEIAQKMNDNIRFLENRILSKSISRDEILENLNKLEANNKMLKESFEKIMGIKI